MGLVEEVAMAAMLNDGISAEAFAEYADQITPIDLDTLARPRTES